MRAIRIDKGKYVLTHEGEVFLLKKIHSKKWMLRYIDWHSSTARPTYETDVTEGMRMGAGGGIRNMGWTSGPSHPTSLEDAKKVAEEYYLGMVMKGISQQF